MLFSAHNSVGYGSATLGICGFTVAAILYFRREQAHREGDPLFALFRCERGEHLSHIIVELRAGGFDQCPAGRLEPHPHSSSIVGVGCTAEEAPALRAHNRTAHARLVGAEIGGELVDGRLTISQDPEQPNLLYRQLRFGGTLLKSRVSHEREPDQGLDRCGNALVTHNLILATSW